MTGPVPDRVVPGGVWVGQGYGSMAPIMVYFVYYVYYVYSSIRPYTVLLRGLELNRITLVETESRPV